MSTVSRGRAALWVTLLTLGWAFSIVIAGFLVALLPSIVFDLDLAAAALIAGAVWVPALGVLGYWLGGKAGKAVVVFEDGVAVAGASGTRAWHWDDVVGVQHRPIVNKPDVPTDLPTAAAVVVVLAIRKARNRPLAPVDTTYRFVDRVGGSFVLDRWLRDVDEVAEVIDAEVTRRRLPVIRREILDGERFQFGPILLDRERLHVGRRSLEWSEFDRVSIDGDVLHVVALDGTSVTVRIVEIANLSVLLQLLPELSMAAEVRRARWA